MKDAISDNLRREADAAAGLVAELRRDGFDGETIHDTVDGATGIMDAISLALAEIDSCAHIIAGCDALIKKYSDRKSKFELRSDRVRAMIEQAMCIADIQTAKLPAATVTLKKVPPKPMIVDESLIPSEFFFPQPPRLDKRAINAAVADGKQIAGVSQDNGGLSLQIRRV